MTYVVTSHHMCHLLEVWDDMFDVTHWAMSIGESTNQCILACNSQTMYRIGPLPRPMALTTAAPVFPVHKGYRTLLNTITHVLKIHEIYFKLLLCVVQTLDMHESSFEDLFV